jgi:hypothetical protein
MLKYVMSVLVIAMCCTLFSVPTASAAAAEEHAYKLQSDAATMKGVIVEHIGQWVLIKLSSGQNLEGIIVSVGDSVVHVEKVAGRNYYDAVVRLDRISAVLFKVRGK